MSEKVSQRLFQRLKSLVFHQPDWDKLERAGEPCPGCGSEDYYKEEGRLTTVYRCKDCRVEGAGLR